MKNKYVIVDNSGLDYFPDGKWYFTNYEVGFKNPPNFTSSINSSKKYNFWITAKIWSLIIGDCIVEKINNI